MCFNKHRIGGYVGCEENFDDWQSTASRAKASL